MVTRFLGAAIALAFFSGVATAQTPALTVVQASTTAPQPTTTVAGPVGIQSAGSPDPSLKTIQELRAANEAILAKQAATLQQLDDIEKAAEQIKIYTKRS